MVGQHEFYRICDCTRNFSTSGGNTPVGFSGSIRIDISSSIGWLHVEADRTLVVACGVQAPNVAWTLAWHMAQTYKLSSEAAYKA